MSVEFYSNDLFMCKSSLTLISNITLFVDPTLGISSIALLILLLSHSHGIQWCGTQNYSL